ncbi:MAG TPA: ABC transporter ATP-binding protein [Solirubrobacteraceae bacterium]|nr:ABC transporter ATP-binding protein [Solirubrobacteraceae bacterium]
MATAIDDGFLAGRSTTGFAWLGVFGACAVIGALATRATILHLAQIVEPFRDTLARLVVAGSLRRSTQAGAAGDTAGVARLTQQVELVRDAYASMLLAGQSFLIATVGALLGLLTLMPQLLLMVAPPLLLGLAMFFAALRHIASRQRDCILAEEHVAEEGAAMAAGIRDIVACGAEDNAAAMVGAHVEAQAEATRDLAQLTAVRSVSVTFGGLLPIVLILASGPWLVRQGATVGTIFGALTYVLQGVYPAMQAFVNAVSGPGLWLMVTLRRIVESSRVRGRAAEDHDAPPTHPPHHSVEFNAVTFAYGPCSEPILRDFDFSIADGEHLVVVGPSGVGKSTLANLLTGVLEPQAGEISIGGVALADIGAAAPAHRVLIPQEAYLFSGTVFENLVYLRPDASRRELENAVQALGMRQLLERLGGFDAELDPADISAGERQLITLVRAYLSPAGLVILDEAGCHLDPRAEAVVEEAFARRPGTLIIIAHRISSALRAHRILVLDGAQVQHGTHAELLARSPLYRDLVGRWQADSITARPLAAAHGSNGSNGANGSSTLLRRVLRFAKSLV